MTQFFGPSDVLSWQLLRQTFAQDFIWTLVAEAAVVTWMVGRKARPNRAMAGRPFVDHGKSQESGWWLLPILVWGYEGHAKTVDTIYVYSAGLSTPPFSWIVLGMYQIFFALACLVLVQALLVAATGGRVSTLGTTGKARLASTAVILAVTSDVLLYLNVWRWFEKQSVGAL